MRMKESKKPLYLFIILLSVSGLIVGFLHAEQGKYPFKQYEEVGIDANYYQGNESLKLELVNGSISNAEAVVLTENYYGLRTHNLNSSLAIRGNGGRNEEGIWASRSTFLNRDNPESLTALPLKQGRSIEVIGVQDQDNLMNGNEVNIYTERGTEFHLANRYFIRNNSAIEAPLGLSMHKKSKSPN